MKKNRLRFKFYVIILFVLCLSFNDFCEGFYDGFLHGMQYGGNIGDIPGRQLAEISMQDKIAYRLIALVTSIVFYSIMNRKLAQPMEELSRSMEKIAKGNLEERVSTNLPMEFQQMETSFNAMAQALQEAQEERIRQDKNNQQLYSNIAHDLKSPMTMVLGYARALERGDIPEERQQEYLRTIASQTEHVNELLDVLLTYTRLENQSFELKLEEHDLAEILRSSVAQYYAAFEEHGTELEIDIPEECVMFRCDALEMRRVFTNLLINMLRHTEYGTFCRVLLERTRDCENRKVIEIRFADEGAFLAESVKENLFQPFCIGDESRNTKGGSGLGLSIAKKVVEKHGGNIYYEEYADGKEKAFVVKFFHA